MYKYFNYIKMNTNNFKRLYSMSISNILHTKNVGDEIELKGWIKSVRKQKENIFIDLNDGSTERLQIVIPQKFSPARITVGTSISAKGILSLSPRGELELSAESISVYGECVIANGYPFAPRKHYSPEYVRQYLHLRPRTNTFSSLLRVRSAAIFAIHSYLCSEGYVNIQTPILTSNDCEGAGELFKVLPDNLRLLKEMIKDGVSIEDAFFDKKVFLSVSGQLHLEAAAHGLSNVYTFGPTFRAENSKTRLHLSEFYMLEAEVAFLENIQGLILIIEMLIKNVTKTVLELNDSDVKICNSENKSDLSWLNKKFPVLEYKEAILILKNNRDKLKQEFNEQKGISKEHELFLVNHCGGIPTFVINWPKDIKPFYMKECEDDTSKVAALDLLAPGVGEIAGGSLRENNYNKLKEKLANMAHLEWYLDLRKYGSVPTGGFGLGFERYLQVILGISSIKDVIPFPRWPHNCSL